MDAIGATVVFVPERGCRMSSVEAAAEAFRRYALAHSLRVKVVVSSDICDAKSGGGRFVVRTMEGQERHGRHAPLVADSAYELYVELASYLYDSAPTKHIIKFEMNALSYEHPLTQAFFGEVARCLPAVATATDFGGCELVCELVKTRESLLVDLEKLKEKQHVIETKLGCVDAELRRLEAVPQIVGGVVGVGECSAPAAPVPSEPDQGLGITGPEDAAQRRWLAYAAFAIAACVILRGASRLLLMTPCGGWIVGTSTTLTGRTRAWW
jgi:hypothetical protein